MSIVTIKIKDNQKLSSLLEILDSLEFVQSVKVKSSKKEATKPVSKKKASKGGLQELKGIWKGREISLTDIRNKAWKQR